MEPDRDPVPLKAPHTTMELHNACSGDELMDFLCDPRVVDSARPSIFVQRDLWTFQIPMVPHKKGVLSTKRTPAPVAHATRCMGTKQTSSWIKKLITYPQLSECCTKSGPPETPVPASLATSATTNMAAAQGPRNSKMGCPIGKWRHGLPKTCGLPL